MRFLLQVADFDARHWASFTVMFSVYACHDAKQCGFTRTVKTQYTNLGAREERKRDVFKNLAFRRYDFPYAVHAVNKLSHKRVIILK
jgi:hypothetical protein